jgi:lytic murein transglycosylase
LRAIPVTSQRMVIVSSRTLAAFVFALSVLCASPSLSDAACRDPAGFGTWLDGVKKEAVAAGIDPAVVSSALANVTYDPNVISHDHGQRVFHQTFEEFSSRMVPPRLRRASLLLKQNASVIDRIETQYGVPGSVIVAIWGLETDFGAVTGNFETLRALATLAYDCRRSDKFHAELLDALRLVQRGDLTPAAMRGAWAGELGQTQFMPSSYLKYAVDFSGNGRRDLIHNVPDVLASTANYLKGYGWQRGAGWEPGQPNFEVIKQWNAADVYARTIANFATRLEQDR